MKHPSTIRPYGPVINRVADVMAHTNKYGFSGVTRLAREAGVHQSSITRLINNEFNPSFLLVCRVTEALEVALGYRIDPRDLVAEFGNFLTLHTCDVVGCDGCLPQAAMDEFGDLKAAFRGVSPGRWVTSRYPTGFELRKTGGNE